MIRPLRTALVLLFVAFSFFAAGCSSLYRPVYSPGKSNYKKPPEKKEAAVELLPPEPAPGAAGGVQGLPEAPAPAPAAPAPGMLDAPPAIPGLPQ
ncbi:MAG: hypothetical protein WCF18_18885 [Chthoniobacteraceae bacterium]